MTISRGTPSQAEILKAWGRYLIDSVDVACIGRVIEVDSSTRMLTVQPVMAEYNGETLAPLPGVRVAALSAGGFTVSLPVSVGDTVLVISMDYSHDYWLVNGQEGLPPEAVRVHDRTDSVAIPLHLGATQPPAEQSSDLVVGLTDASAALRVTPAGVVGVEGASVRLGDLSASDGVITATQLDSYLSALDTALTTAFTAVGGSWPGSLPYPAGSSTVKSTT